MKRVIVFLDYSNFHGMMSQLTNKEFPNQLVFDFGKYIEKLTNGMDLIKVYFACSSISEHSQKQFFDYMDRQPYFYVKQFDRRINSSGNQREKQVDVYLATQIVALAYENAYDIGIIVSGDEDFIPAIEVVQQKGKVIWAVSADGMLSDELKKKADRIIKMNTAGELNFKNFVFQKTNEGKQ